MKLGQYCQRQRCRHAELKQFRQAFASRGFVSDSWAFLLIKPSRLQRTARRAIDVVNLGILFRQ